MTSVDELLDAGMLSPDVGGWLSSDAWWRTSAAACCRLFPARLSSLRHLAIVWSCRLQNLRLYSRFMKHFRDIVSVEGLGVVVCELSESGDMSVVPLIVRTSGFDSDCAGLAAGSSFAASSDGFEVFW